MMSKVKKHKLFKTWTALKAGDLVDIIAPASRCPVQELEAGEAVLRSWGLRVRRSSKLFGESLLHSNSDKERWHQLKAALMAKDSAAIWCVRGGYGSLKLLPLLAKMKVPSRPKVFLGLSDLTSLNIFFNQHWKWPVLHAPILSRVGRGDLPPSSLQELREVLFGETQRVDYQLSALNPVAEKIKIIEGPVVGGNWTTLMSGIATPYQLRPKGSILFLEDVGERGYRLDRYWEQLHQMDFLNQLSAIVLGDFTEGDEPNGTNLIWDVLKMRAQSFKKPVYYGLPVGHGRIQRVLPLGVQLKIVRHAAIISASFPTGIDLNG